MEREACACDHGFERSDLCAEIIIIIIIPSGRTYTREYITRFAREFNSRARSLDGIGASQEPVAVLKQSSIFVGFKHHDSPCRLFVGVVVARSPLCQKKNQKLPSGYFWA